LRGQVRYHEKRGRTKPLNGKREKKGKKKKKWSEAENQVNRTLTSGRTKFG